MNAGDRETMREAGTAWSIVGLSIASDYPAPATTLAVSLIDALIDRTFSLGRVLDMAGRVLDGEAGWRVSLEPIATADLLILSVPLDQQDSVARLEQALAHLDRDVLHARRVLLAAVGDEVSQDCLDREVVPLLAGHGADILPARLLASRDDFRGPRLVNAQLAGRIDVMAADLARFCGARAASMSGVFHPFAPLGLTPLHH